MSKEIMQQALDALKKWDALIKYQYGGSSEAMTAMQYAAWLTLDTIEGLEQELAKLAEPPDYVEPLTSDYHNGWEEGFEAAKNLFTRKNT